MSDLFSFIARIFASVHLNDRVTCGLLWACGKFLFQTLYAGKLILLSTILVFMLLFNPSHLVQRTRLSSAGNANPRGFVRFFTHAFSRS